MSKNKMQVKHKSAETAQAIWDFLRRARSEKTSVQIREATEAGQQYLSRCLNVWEREGLVERGDRTERDGFYWTFTGEGPLPPIIKTDKTTVERAVGMKASDLARLRRRANLSLADVAAGIGWSRKSARNIQRMERDEVIIGTETAEKMRWLFSKS